MGFCSHPHEHAVSAAQCFPPQLCPGTRVLSPPPAVTALVSVDPKGSRGLAVPGGPGPTSAIGRDTFPLPFLAWVDGGWRGLAGGCLVQ